MSARAVRLRALLQLTALCSTAGVSGAAAPSPGTDGAAPQKSAAQEEAAVLAHLNSALAWSHEMRNAEGGATQPGDEFYETNQQNLTNQILAGAFGYAKAMEAVIGAEKPSASQGAASDPREARLTTLIATNTERLAGLRSQLSALNQKIAAAPPSDPSGLTARREVLQAEIDLDAALDASLKKSISLFAASNGAGPTASLADQIAALERAEPAAFASTAAAPVKPAPPAAPSAAPSTGLVDRASTLFSLLRHRHSIETLTSKAAALQSAATGLAEGLAAERRAVLQAGDDASQDANRLSDPAQLAQAGKKIEGQAARFRSFSAALPPLQQEARALENSRANLAEWKRSLSTQSDVILRDLFVRAIVLALALAVLIGFSEVWRRATFKYVHDARRRRQLLLIRRFATAILTVVIIVMGFVSDFSSLATFAGFITAGIAVALQTVILSIAAYFFLIGRYGVRVGDRVTVSGVTGDVIDIGLVRVFLMELAGTGVNLHPTGRVVVLANSALFSTTPLYKQLPGTNYAWHEVYVTMAGDADAAPIEQLLMKAVNSVYDRYRSSLESQHGALERLLDFKTDLPVPSAHVRLTEAGLEAVVRYPVEIRKMSEVDDDVTKQVLAAVRGDEDLKKTLGAMPRIRAAVKS